MATTPVTPVIVPSQGWAWLKAHERLVMLALVLFVGYWGYAKYTDSAAVKAEARATVAEQALVAQKSQNDAMASQTASVLAQFQTLQTATAALNTQLAQASAQREASTKAQQTADATMALPDLANRLKTLGNAPDGSVLVNGNYIEFTQPGAVAVAQTLETIPALTANLKDQTALATGLQTTLVQGQTVIADQAKQITGLNTAAVEQDKACKAQIAQVNAEANKSKRKWFFRGVLVGFIGGLWSGHAGL